MRKNTSLTCHRKCLTVSEGNIVCQGCVCMYYLCISHSGLPVEVSTGSHGRGMWVCYSHPGPCNLRLQSYWEQVYKRPPSSSTQHTSARQNKLQRQHPLTTAAPTPKQARITSQPDYSVCIRSRCNGTSVVRDE